MNIFANLTTYPCKWKLTSSRPFSSEEKSLMSSAEVVASQYGMSCCFHLVSGDLAYIPMSRDSLLNAGDKIDINHATLQTISRPGEKDLYRVLE